MKNFKPLSPREVAQNLIEQDPEDIQEAVDDLIENQVNDDLFDEAGEQAFNAKGLRFGY